MELKKYAINGLFLTQRMTGVHRYAFEIVSKLDKMVSKHSLKIIAPVGADYNLHFENIEVIQYGKLKGIPWEQINFCSYLRKKNLIGVNLCNEQPLFSPGIICIHDIAYKTHPAFFPTLHGRLSVAWHRILFRQACRSYFPILTVSQFSKQSIVKVYGVLPDKVHVIGNAWQHMQRFELDSAILSKHDLKPGSFYFTLGNININKNTKWIVDYAQEHPEEQFVLSGPKAKVSNIDIEVDNIKYLGYLSDEEIKTLYQSCKAFIFPSIHEGFGIPPLEALSQGAEIIVSNTTSLPEIFEESAHYIDPLNTDVDLRNLVNKSVKSSEGILKKYSWEKSAAQLLALLEEFQQS